MAELAIENIGWTLGNDCPYRCTHCYSDIVRNRGRNLEKIDIDRIVDQLKKVGVKTVNLGGNEPIFTNGPDPKQTLLPYIIRSLHESEIVVGLTTAGITLIQLERLFPDTIPLLNDVDVSLDSPFAEEHNKNRGAALYNVALKALGICHEYDIDRTIVMCGMRWNLSTGHLAGLISLAKNNNSLIRINFMKPTELRHMDLVPDAATFYSACRYLLERCKVVDAGEPFATVLGGEESRGCPCGTKSFRIHSITPTGQVPVSPCVYAHDYKTGDLLTDNLEDIIRSSEFKAFRNRREHPESIGECSYCSFLKHCKGGCASRAYLWAKFTSGKLDLPNVRDPYCIRDHKETILSAVPSKTKQNEILVHRDYLCTLILEPSF